MLNIGKVHSFFDYYHDGVIRVEVMELKGVDKDHNLDAKRTFASFILRKVSSDAIFVLMCNHHGRVLSLRDLGHFLLDAGHQVYYMTGATRASQYYTKKFQEKILKGSDFGFVAPTMENIDGKPIYLIDDVIGTGETIKAALEVLPNQTEVISYAIDVKSFLYHNNLSIEQLTFSNTKIGL